MEFVPIHPVIQGKIKRILERKRAMSERTWKDAAAENIGWLFVPLVMAVAATAGMFKQWQQATENREAIRAGYVQQVQDGHVIWVKPSSGVIDAPEEKAR